MSENGQPLPPHNATVTLREITKDTVRDILRLKVAPQQEHFVASNAVSLAQALFYQDVAWFRAVYADETPVGFLMLEDDVAKESYFLWRFMIDARYQGRGYGQQAIALLVDHVKTRPGATNLLVSCVPGEGSPCPFYEKLGFVDTGKVDDGEIVLSMKL